MIRPSLLVGCLVFASAVGAEQIELPQEAFVNDAARGPVTTVTFEEKGGRTLLVLRELHSSKEALDAAGTGAADAMVARKLTLVSKYELRPVLPRATHLCGAQITDLMGSRS